MGCLIYFESVSGRSTSKVEKNSKFNYGSISDSLDEIGSRKDPCDSSPCLNNGTCVKDSRNEYHCNCTPGWTGKHCTEAIDECQKPEEYCVHGSCTNGDGNYTCICYLGWTGTDCNTKVTTPHPTQTTTNIPTGTTTSETKTPHPPQTTTNNPTGTTTSETKTPHPPQTTTNIPTGTTTSDTKTPHPPQTTTNIPTGTTTSETK